MLYFPHLNVLSATVLTRWVAPPKMFCNWYRIYKRSRNQLWDCTHFRHPTDEQIGSVDIFFSNYYNLQSVYFELRSVNGSKGQQAHFIAVKTRQENFLV